MQAFITRDCTICGASDHVLLMEDGPCAYRQCRICQAIFASPLPATYEAVNESAYEAAITKYTAKIDARLAQHQKVLRPLERFRKQNTFLEIGCNAGATLFAAGKLGWQATGVDLSRAATTYAREVRGLNALTGTLESLALPAESFDVIYSNAVLEHIEHPRATLLEALRVLRKGGALYAATVNWDSYTRRFLGAGWSYLEPMHHVQLFTPANVAELARRTGFLVERIWTTGVRLSDTKAGKVHTAAWPLSWCKGPLSLATRFTNRGDSIKFLLRKPA
jgi:SAM-dependent methyltransferase